MEKLLPQNIEAESAVLGSIIINPDLVDRAGFLVPEDFYRDAHRILFVTIMSLKQKGVEADFITICDDLERRNKLEDVGGAGYITSLINQVPTWQNVEYYGRIVQRTGVLRRLIAACGEIAGLAYQDDLEVEQVLEQAERAIFQITQRFLLTRGTDINMKDLMTLYMEQLNERYENRGRVVGVPTGYADLDRLLGGLQRSDLDILAAKTSMGKTAFALNLAYNVATRYGRGVGIFSLEMSKEQLAQRFVALESGLEQQKLRTGRIFDEDWEPLESAVSKLSGLNIWIDDTGGISLQQLKSRARGWVAEYGIELIIVDYLQLMESGANRKNENREQEVSRISRGLKALAKDLGIPVLALAQLSRALDSRQSKIPQLSDLRESGSIEMDADVVMFIYREEIYNPDTDRRGQADIIIAKQRNGPLGEVTLMFDPTKSRFSDVASVIDGEVAFAEEDDQTG